MEVSLIDLIAIMLSPRVVGVAGLDLEGQGVLLQAMDLDSSNMQPSPNSFELG